MSQSVTVLSGVSNSSIGGLVTVPLDIQASIASALQSLLDAESASVVAGTYGLTNVNVVGQGINGPYTTPYDTLAGGSSIGAAASSGIVEYTNTSVNGFVDSPGSASFSTYYTPDYNTVIVQAPGDSTVKGEGSNNQLVILGQQSQVRFNPNGGSGTVIAGGSGDVVNTSGNWTLDGSTDGGDQLNGNGSSLLINTYGPIQNGVQIVGGNATVNMGGTDDNAEIDGGASAIISVIGAGSVVAGGGYSENVIVKGGSATVYAASGSSGVNVFFQTGGNLYFVNQSTVQAFVTGDAPGAVGGQDTVFGGTGGGLYYGGNAGANSLIGGFAPGQASTAGGPGLVTLIGGGSSNNFMEAMGSLVGGGNTGNLLIAGGTGTVIGGSATLMASGTTSVNTFQGANAANFVVSTAGAGLQTFDLIGTNKANPVSETITGSTAATASNLFLVSDPSSVGANVYITNFSTASGAHDLVSMTGGISVAGVTSVVGGSLNGKLEFQLSDGTNIVMTNINYTTAYKTAYLGKTTI